MPITQTLTISPKGQGTAAEPGAFTFTLQPRTGLFSGTFEDAGAASRSYQGVIFQSDRSGAGLFSLGVGTFGQVTLQQGP